MALKMEEGNRGLRGLTRMQASKSCLIREHPRYPR
jgi:hypothetical protein